MPITFTATKDAPADVDAFIVPIFSTPDGPFVPPSAAGAEYLDAAHLKTSGVTGKTGMTHSVPGANGTTIIGVGAGEAKAVTAEVLRAAFALVARAGRRFAKIAASVGTNPDAAMDPKLVGQAIAEGVVLGTYRFARHKKPGEADALSEFVVLTTAKAKMQAGLDRGATVARFQCNARDWVNEPAGELNPTTLAAEAKKLAAESPTLKLTVWDEKQIEKEKLGALRGVSLGSDQPPRLIRLEYNPPAARKTLFFVGKGITFDSGGLSLKTAQGMETMKTDMGGAAAVLNAAAACAALGVKTRIVALAACTENMPGPKAIKPGDVLRARNGVTMEVLNTDAEGRLVLSDALSLAAEEKPNGIVDVATLTGAQIVALGSRIAAVLGNNDALMQKVKDAAASAGELVWELPLPDIYRKHIDSEIADIKNIGAAGQAGTIAGAMFLKEFVDGQPWVHIDIAGPARAAEQEGEIVKGGTGFSVRTLVELAAGLPVKLGDSVTVHVDADPMTCWGIASDVTRIGELSPETFEAEWLDGATGPAVGAKFRGHVKRNGIGPTYWTPCTVTKCEPGKVFEFAVGARGVNVNNWGYTFEASDGGTNATEYFRLEPTLPLRLYWALLGWARGRTNREGMTQTLNRLKAIAEA